MINGKKWTMGVNVSVLITLTHIQVYLKNAINKNKSQRTQSKSKAVITIVINILLTTKIVIRY